MALKQANRQLSLSTPLGDDVLLLTGFAGHEEMSRLFQFQLDMISDDANVAAKDIVGKNVTFAVQLADQTPRYFNGFVTRFFAGSEDREGRRNYRAEVVPWLWFLTRTSDCRIFQNMTAPDIIEKIFGDLGFSDYKMSAQGTHPEREYCVQYRETDFNFVSRLLEEEGMYYFFNHENGKHEMVIADKPTGYIDCLEPEANFPIDSGGRAMDDHITSWEHRYEFRTGKWAQTDYDFKNPSTSLMNNSSSVLDLPGIDNYEHYDFPGIYVDKGDGKDLTDLRMEEEEVEHDVVYGTSMCRTFTPGGKFKIGQHKSSSEEGKKFVITSVRHRAAEPQAYETGAASSFDYTNSFTCMPDKVVFRPARITPKPFVQGVQTAIITGPPGEEIYTDEYGRVKVQFHWDREGQRDENTTCFMRVSQVHAGKGFGGIDIPRIDEEVIVSFLEGDPDRPIITGRVYHAENMPPFGLPDSKTISGLKSKTYKGDGYNELVMDDTPGNELVRTHAQFDMDTTVENDQRSTVHNNRTDQIDVDDSETVGSNQTILIGANQDLTVGANQSTSVGANQDTTVGASQSVSVGAARSVSISASDSLDVGGAQSISVGGSQSISATGPITISSAAKITLSVGGSAIEITPGGINIVSAGPVSVVGAIVKVNS